MKKKNKNNQFKENLSFLKNNQKPKKRENYQIKKLKSNIRNWKKNQSKE